MIAAKVKNWSQFQHYKDRAPPWLKLHRGLLDDFDFARLPVASKALAPMIWLLASESEDGIVNVDPEWLAFRLRCPVAEVKAGLTPLIDKGFLILDSKALAECLHDACLEGETEGERETETETEGEGAASAAPAAPKPAKRPKRQELTFTEWADTLEGEAIPLTDPVFAASEKSGLPADFVSLAWGWFEGEYGAGGFREAKRYADWRAVFRKAVAGNWGRLWAVNRQGEFYLTTEGVQAQRALA